MHPTWRRMRSDLESVPFVIREGTDEIAVEGNALADGLIVVPRVWRGNAIELGNDAPVEAKPADQVRVVIE